MERAMAEPTRRREKQTEFNAANSITPESVKARIAGILDSVYERDHVLISTGGRHSGAFGGAGAAVAHNIEADPAHLPTRTPDRRPHVKLCPAARHRHDINR